jgi:predicted Zn-dependent protease
MHHQNLGSNSLGHHSEAVTLAEKAAALAPDDTAVAIHAAELLLRCDRADAAAEILHAAAAQDCGDPVLLRLLSAAEMMRGHLDAAPTAIDAALALAPQMAEYYLHRGQDIVETWGFPAKREETFMAFGNTLFLHG